MQKDQLFNNANIVQISPQGIYKYILIQLTQDGQNNPLKLFIRGSIQYQYHADNFAAFQQQLKKLGYKTILSKSNNLFKAQLNNKKYRFKALGGGRIEHNYKGNKCFIYGYSKSYGRIDHKIAQQLISKHLGYKIQQIKTSQQGY